MRKCRVGKQNFTQVLPWAKIKKWHLSKKISEGATGCLFHLPLQALVATIIELTARAGTIFHN